MNETVPSLTDSIGFSDTARPLDAPPAFLEMLPVAIYACDGDGRILWFNGRAAELWGREPRIGDDFERFCRSHRMFHDGREIPYEATSMAHALGAGESIRDAEVVIQRPNGSQVCVMVHIETIRDADGRVQGAIGCLHDISGRKAAEAELKESERRSREILEALPAAVYTTDADGRITFYNEAAVTLSGRRPELGGDQWCVTWRLYNTDGTPMPHDECPMAVALKEDRAIRGAEAVAERPDGVRVPFIPFPTPLHDASGALVGAVNMLVDISERKRAENRQKALVDELNHRVKNTLATVQAIASQTIRGARVPRSVVSAFERRLFALSSAHDHLSRGAWESAELSAILDDVLSPFRDDGAERVSLAGEAVALSPKGALALAMVLHELAANAAKFGALSIPGGSVAVHWRTEDGKQGRRLLLDWEEAGGPRVTPPTRRGFGTRVLERAVNKELRGSTEIRFEPSGMRGRIDVPLASVMAA